MDGKEEENPIDRKEWKVGYYCRNIVNVQMLNGVMLREESEENDWETVLSSVENTSFQSGFKF